MTKLHEILAVEGSLEKQAKKVMADLANTFEKKRHLFERKLVTFQPMEEGQPAVVEIQSSLQSKVVDELAWVSGHIVKSLDASYQVDCGNTVARANIVLEDGTILAKGVPATALLSLEKRIKEIADLLKTVPTLDPARGFKLDPDSGTSIYAASEIVKTRTKKTKKVIVMYEATKEHPAQVHLMDTDEPTGKLRELEWSSLLTPAEKAELINKAEMVERAIRQARSRANNVEVDGQVKIGGDLLDYILK